MSSPTDPDYSYPTAQDYPVWQYRLLPDKTVQKIAIGSQDHLKVWDPANFETERLVKQSRWLVGGHKDWSLVLYSW